MRDMTVSKLHEILGGVRTDVLGQVDDLDRLLSKSTPESESHRLEGARS